MQENRIQREIFNFIQLQLMNQTDALKDVFVSAFVELAVGFAPSAVARCYSTSPKV
jgi:hypothetical protein